LYFVKTEATAAVDTGLTIVLAVAAAFDTRLMTVLAAVVVLEE